MKTRAEHLQWCKDRALEYANAGDHVNAMASIASDLAKHPETEDLAPLAGTLGMAAVMDGSKDAMVKVINGFN